MKAAEMRQSILQAAVQGKLVPQNIHDEPASELLKRIQEEKAQLVKDGKLKKEKPLPPITEDEIPYDLPEGWIWCRLGELFLKLTDGAHSTPRYIDHGVPFLSVKDVSSGKIDFSATRFISKEEHDGLYKRCNPEKGDILLTKVGTTGIPIIVDTENEFSLFVSIALLKTSKMNSNIDFLCHLIKSPVVYSQSQENTRGVGNKNWVLTAISNTIVPLPPLAEQQRIVAKVDELMALCDEYEAAEKELDKLEVNFAEYLPKSILQAAVQGKLVPQNIHDEPASELLKRIQKEKAQLVKDGKLKKEKPLPPITEDEIPYDLPEGWVWCRLGEIGDWGAGATPLRSEPKYYENGSINWLKTGELNNGVVYESQEKITEIALKECSLRMNKVGDILVAMYGATIGKLAIVGSEMTTNQACCGCTPYSGIYNMFLFYLLKGNKDALIEQGEGGAQPNISRIKIRTFAVPLPPLAEQQRIVAKVDELMALCDELKAARTFATASNVIPFPEQVEDEELLMVAQGEVSGKLSNELKQAQEDLFEDGANE